MKTLWLAAVLASASLFASADGGVQGVLKPADPQAKAVETPRLKASPAAGVSLQLPSLGAARTKSLANELAPNQVGISRRADVDALPRIDSAGLQWKESAGGHVAHIRVAAPDALGLRVGLRFDALPRDLEIRVAQVAADGSLQVVGVTTGASVIKLARGVMPIEHWTASTDGAEQVIELWSPRAPGAAALRFAVIDVSHLFQRTTELNRTKLDFACHVDIACVAGADLANDSKAVAKMRFSHGGSTFVCTGALLNDRVSSLTPLFATANHCISTQASAATLETWFFYRDAVCNALTPQPQFIRINDGAILLMADFNTDFTLLRLNSVMPGNAFFLGWEPASLTAGQEVFGIHHPNGELQRYSSGIYQGLTRITNSGTHITFTDFFSRVKYTQGTVEGGSSGSPLLTGTGQFRGTLFGSPDTNTCGGNVFASYSSFHITYPLVKTFLDGPNAGDDFGDSPASAAATDLNTKFVGNINNAGDEDWLRFTITAGGTWTVASFDPAEGAGTDVKAEMYAANGATVLASSDDISDTDRNFSITRLMTPGTYYVRVTGVNGATGRYGVRSSFVLPDDFGDSSGSATELPLNGTRAGLLGVLNDQDWFKFTFTQPGTFRAVSLGDTDTMGAIYQGDGFTLITENDDANFPDTNFGVSAVITAPGVRYLKVSGFDGQTGPYTLQTSFTAGEDNYTDIWWNPAESGWGINLNHQSDTIFASLFTYANDNKGLWLVGTITKQANGSFTGPLYRTAGPAFNASPWTATTPTQVGTMTIAFSATTASLSYSVNGVNVSKTIQRQVFAGVSATCSATTSSRAAATNYQDLWWNPGESGWGVNFAHQGATIFATLFTYGADNRDMWLTGTIARQPDGSFLGSLFRTTGPAFNASPWTAIAVETVGTMQARFTNGAAGTLTYTVNGVSVTKAIERQVFAAAPSVCQ